MHVLVAGGWGAGQGSARQGGDSCVIQSPSHHIPPAGRAQTCDGFAGQPGVPEMNWGSKKSPLVSGPKSSTRISRTLFLAAPGKGVPVYPARTCRSVFSRQRQPRGGLLCRYCRAIAGRLQGDWIRILSRPHLVKLNCMQPKLPVTRPRSILFIELSPRFNCCRLLGGVALTTTKRTSGMSCVAEGLPRPTVRHHCARR